MISQILFEKGRVWIEIEHVAQISVINSHAEHTIPPLGLQLIMFNN